MDLKRLLLISGLIRIFLILYGELQDRLLHVKYTDIDYTVFTDAARFVAEGQSPYLRSTYRYSPLLAYLLLPNVLGLPAFGKVVFSAADLVAGWQLWQLARQQQASEGRALAAAAAWMFNPFTLPISTRGSCDSLVAVMLLGLLQLLFRGWRLAAALLYGLAVHFRIYPILFAPAIVLFLAQRAVLVDGRTACGAGSSVADGAVDTAGRSSGAGGSSSAGSADADASAPARPTPAAPVRGAPSWRSSAFVRQLLAQGAVFGCQSGTTFLALAALFYAIYGSDFLQHAFLHHLGRRDPRHNFSPYFYHIYLTFPMQPATTSAATAATAAAALDASRWAFVPQLGLLAVLATYLSAHLPLCLLAQTLSFVAFNKVSTAQYFSWYYCLLPLALPALPWPPPTRLTACLAAWAACQLHWLAWAYLLEFQSAPVFLPLWAAGLAFLAANVALLCTLLTALRPGRSFLQLSADAAAAEGGAARRVARRGGVKEATKHA